MAAAAPGGRAGASREQVAQAIRAAARDELALLSLAGFMRAAWTLVEPHRPLVWNWHYDVLCDELERVARGETRELVVCLPPGVGKSIVVQAMFLAWDWLHHPERRTLTLSASQKPVTKYAIAMRSLVQSAWYQRLAATAAERAGREPWSIRDDQNQKLNYENTATGSRGTGPFGGRVIGDRVDGLIVDDPNDARDVVEGTPSQIAERMEETVTVYDEVLASRVDSVTGWRIVIMQRLHEGDLAGALLKRGVRSVVLPMEFEADLPNRHQSDPRTKPGELLFEKRFDRAFCARVKSTPNGARVWNAQYQQRPSPVTGSLFKRLWLTREDRRYRGDPLLFARSIQEQAISIDCTFRDTKTADFVVMQAWGRDGVRKYLFDQVRGRMDFPATMAAAKAFCSKWPRARLKLVEAKANGDALIRMLAKEMPGLVGYEPRASKYARAQVSSLAFEAGEIWLPEPEWAPWISDYIEEHIAFPGGLNDDQVDGTSQMVIRWESVDADGPDALTRTRQGFGFMGNRASS